MDLAFFVLSKSVWLILRPDTLLILLGLAALVVARRQPRRGAWLGGGVLAIAVAIGLFPIHVWLLRPLEERFPAQPALSGAVAGIVQLGGSEALDVVRRTGMPQLNAAGDRYVATLTLARMHPQAPVIFAGGGAMIAPDGAEASMARALLVGAGLDPARLSLDRHSRNTAENARNARALAPDPLGGPWLLVTSAFHMPRAVGAFCAAGWSGLVPWPVDHNAGRFRIGWDPSGNLGLLTLAVREWVGLVAYRATGRTDALLPAGC